MISSSMPATTPNSARSDVEAPDGGAPLRTTPGQIRVLILEDSEADAQLIHDELSRAGFLPLIERVDSAEKFEAALVDFLPDVVLSEYSLAQADAEAAYDLVRKIRPT